MPAASFYTADNGFLSKLLIYFLADFAVHKWQSLNNS